MAKYRFGRAKRWYVERDGSLYDSKAIAAVAIGYQHPERGPMWNDEFSGGERSVKATTNSFRPHMGLPASATTSSSSSSMLDTKPQ
ncbi:MAG: hypothetical protein M3P18_18960 [Actinomycetota bacterium]|nr:hypothetical protein [Actinomycetota bacterium]